MSREMIDPWRQYGVKLEKEEMVDGVPIYSSLSRLFLILSMTMETSFLVLYWQSV